MHNLEHSFVNPFRPGAGHQPPYLAGRTAEIQEFKKLLDQKEILENLILTGLRGTGKTVLLDNLKPIALEAKWLWAGNDLSESSSISEEKIVVRLLTDLSVVTSSFQVSNHQTRSIGFDSKTKNIPINLDFHTFKSIYDNTPGLPADKLKNVLEIVWEFVKNSDYNGIIFAYDEAQNLSDHSAKEEYPTSLLLDVFQSIQKKGIPFMLVLVGLPTLFPKLVECRTFAERMFHVLFLDRLNESDSREAILKPIEKAGCPVSLHPIAVNSIIEISGGYPYFIQFICREAYDAFLQGQSEVPVDGITRKLDNDFFAGRWARATDRQRDLLYVIAMLENSDLEFSANEISQKSKEALQKSFTPSHVNQILSALIKSGLIYKNRHGKYSFAVPLLGQFIQRQIQNNSQQIEIL